METVAETVQADEQPFEWMLVEIFGHRTHWGRGIEVERFGAKMLRIDVPQVEWTTPTEEKPAPEPIATGWVTHFYGGASIFSNTLTDERTVLVRNAPYAKPALYLAPPDEEEPPPAPSDDDPFIDRDDDGPRW
ncbi:MULTISPECIES: hypothetical protein [unclassified Mesorhizobium]|uniref:hypothetical protein n=1 Tax=unclassified Mesorhizobium TaxID=325217 RepID=UPI0015E46BF5|nr:MULTISPECIES: hypothetical protein [unclassified Mesorhizobium]